MTTPRIFSRFLAVAALVAAALLPLEPLHAQGPRPGVTYWFAQAQDELGRPITTGVTCHVFNAGLTTTATIYSDVNLTTTKSNPFTADTIGQCTWFAPSSVTTVDLIVYHKRGRSRMDAMVPSNHRVIVDLQPQHKVLRIPFVTTASGEINTGVTLPYGAVVVDVVVETVTAAAGQSIDVGLLSSESGGDADGFCVNLTVSAVGFVRCGPTSVGVGLTANHRGALLIFLFEAAGATHKGFYLEKPHMADGTAKTITYTRNEAHTTAAGYIHIKYLELQNDL